MAKIPVTRFRATGLKKHQSVFLEHLYSVGEFHVDEEVFDGSSAVVSEFDLAQLDYLIGFLSKRNPGVAEGSLLTGGRLVFSEEDAKARADAFRPKLAGLVRSIEVAQETLVRAENEMKKLEEMRSALLPWKDYMGASGSLDGVDSYVGSVSPDLYEALQVAEADALFVMRQIGVAPDGSVLVSIAAYQSGRDQVRGLLGSGFAAAPFQKFKEIEGDSPAEKIASIDARIHSLEEDVVRANAVFLEADPYLEDAKILHEFTRFSADRDAVLGGVYSSEAVFVLEGWGAPDDVSALSKWSQKAFVGGVDVSLLGGDEVSADVVEPALVKNNWLVRPFEVLTNMFGAPTKKDIDPAPFMWIFYLIFFGICLSDVGYGLLLVLTGGGLLTFGTYDQDTRDTLKFIFMCGIAATLGGVALGGYFGMTIEQAPSFLVAPSGDRFIGQLLKPLEGSGPLDFLMFSLYVGMVQLLAGVLVEFYKKIQFGDYASAFLDSMAWFLFLVSLFGFALADQIGLPVEIMKWAAMGTAGVLVLTQGREQENILLKPLFGILGLYGVMNYVSDILSYSRLMALGLATGVIAFAMNTTAGVLFDMIGIPGISHLVAVVVLLFGHTLNFGLSMLGASIHSMRLQFIEFFGRFYTGGGELFKPFARKMNYLFFRS